MATRIDLPKELVQAALQTKIASTRRSIASSTNAIIKDVLQKELAALFAAETTLTEVK